MRHSAPAGRRTGGFTLIEILVVGAIVAVLAILISPVLKRMMDGAKSAACMAHLRLLGVGCRSFAAENDNRFPLQKKADPDDDTDFSDRWHRQIYPYINAAGTPASWGSKKFETIDKLYLCPADAEPNPKGLSYGFNQYLMDKRVLDCPRDMVMLGDNKGVQFRETTWDFRHNQMINVCFVDGHVEQLKEVPKEILRLTQ